MSKMCSQRLSRRLSSLFTMQSRRKETEKRNTDPNNPLKGQEMEPLSQLTVKNGKRNSEDLDMLLKKQNEQLSSSSSGKQEKNVKKKTEGVKETMVGQIEPEKVITIQIPVETRTVLRNIFLPCFLALIVYIVYVNMPPLSKQYREMYTSFPYRKCIMTSPGSEGYARYLESEFEFSHTRDSMLHHMMQNEYNAICAFDVGVPLCYCVLRYSGNEVVEMFNLNITAVSNTVVLHEERSHFCADKGSILVERREHIWAEYFMMDGNRLDKPWSHDNAYHIQHMVDMNSGVSICEKPENPAALIVNL